jgi:hypothetical protein
MNESISFVTNCYEKDYTTVLDTHRLISNIASNGVHFDEKIIIVNIFKKNKIIEDMCKQLINDNVITHYYMTCDYISEIHTQFNISKSSFSNEWIYNNNMFNLASIYLSKSKYMVFYTGDSICIQPSNWIPDSIKLFSSSSDVIVCNNKWAEDITNQQTRIRETNEFYIGIGFSDQNYMVRRADVLNDEILIYRSPYPYPHGDTFEMRFDGYMRKHNKLRATHKLGIYKHKNF